MKNIGVNEIIEEIQKTLDKACSDLIKEKTKTERTKRIKTDLVTLGREKGFSPCAHSVDDEGDWGEWLYDVSWLEYYDMNTCEELKRMVLAVESEWGTSPKEIYEDFNKLLVCNADIKLMIFQDKVKLFQDLIGTVKNYERRNGIFLLACLHDENSDKEKRFYYKQIR